MSFSDHYENRFVLLIENFKVSILAGTNIKDSIIFFAGKFTDVPFLGEIRQRFDSGMVLEDSLAEQLKREFSEDNKKFIGALNSGDFAVQKLEDLRVSLLKNKKDDFEKVSGGLNSKLGWLAMFALIPIGVYLMSTLSTIFAAAELTDLVVSDSVKVMALVACGVLFLFVLFSKRVKNG